MSWQPIETAPKDGTEIDVWCWHGGEGYRVANAWWSRPDGKWTTYGCSYVTWMHQPSHWMPLPSPPARDSQNPIEKPDIP